MTITAQTICDLLAERHSNDVFIQECKSGPSNEGYIRLDAWAMRKSWARPYTFGYEIKVSRGDFMADEKWEGYLQYCSDFYFVCPYKLIAPEELPQDVGLMWVSKNAKRLFIKRKAAHRKIEVPELLYRYILMTRCRIGESEFSYGAYHQKSDGQSYWKQWLKDREIDYNFGQMVGRAIREAVTNRVIAVERENKDLKEKHEMYELLKRVCEKLKVHPSKYLDELSIERQLTHFQKAFPAGLQYTMKMAVESLQRAVSVITNIETTLKNESNKN